MTKAMQTYLMWVGAGLAGWYLIKTQRDRKAEADAMLKWNQQQR